MCVCVGGDSMYHNGGCPRRSCHICSQVVASTIDTVTQGTPFRSIPHWVGALVRTSHGWSPIVKLSMSFVTTALVTIVLGLTSRGC
ncbi:hypothetical protein BDV30DRAFT_221277 [Aspergillus minisclerotigenes]|uniref:Uncharacterized protein n=1 Tax=Aspergillus minisclerotigenes TaxID=656917 RepID=A0A5N6ILR3_9EURO|nr:hypothetical protein BDV30DRAFT_221277 [Aspergillus minisclerotigenes]